MSKIWATCTKKQLKTPFIGSNFQNFSGGDPPDPPMILGPLLATTSLILSLSYLRHKFYPKIKWNTTLTILNIHGRDWQIFWAPSEIIF